MAGVGDGLYFGGKFNHTGSVANIIVVESARPEIEIGFWDYFRVGLPITISTLLGGSLWLQFVPY